MNFSIESLKSNKKDMELNYYTNKLVENINSEPDYQCVIVDTNFYREEYLQKENLSIVKNFLNSINKNSYVLYNKKTIPQKPLYKIFLIFSNEKFVINVYNENYVSIHSWDGYHRMDYIDTSSIPYSYNLYNLCNFLIPR
ncbi:putative lipoprotein [Clostridium cochlearium]|uniref:Putative lipoprotein n=2 Tax=Clostridium cochlearium TaxID=1494 RepID=A0A2X2W1U4_CLOCO|nr:putative lipoprotein [Clostridium cochlearium]